MTTTSPITNSQNVEKISAHEKSIMSDGQLKNAGVENWICLDTGLIFNATGPRGSEEGFYTDEYDLHNESEVSEFKYFESNKEVGIYDDIVSFVSPNARNKENPHILDVGCGKGLLLSKLKSHFPNSTLSGVEPSSHAQAFFQKVLPEVDLFEGVFEKSPFMNNKAEIVVSNGVLEHVPDPVEFLRNLRKTLKEDGILYIGVPNFENNPADLFTYDHLSRFTPDTIGTVFSLAGFEVIDSKISDRRVPMWFVLKLTTPEDIKNIHVDIQKAQKLAQKSIKEVDAFFSSYKRAADSAQRKSKKIALYGTGMFGFIGTCYTDMSIDLIDKIIDDNSSIWGSQRFGIPVKDPKSLKDAGEVSEVVISANPCYVGMITEKLEGLVDPNHITVHSPVFDQV